MRPPISGRLLAIALGLAALGGCANRFDDTLANPGPGPEPAAPGAPLSSGDERSAAGPGDEPRPASAGQLQQVVMDFSDRYVSAVWQALDATAAAEPDLATQVRAQRLKVALATAAMTIAASKDPRANLLDMAVFLSAGRWAVDRYWLPQVFGKNGAPLRAAYAELDRDIWSEVDGILTPAQRADLRNLIAAWKADNPEPREVFDVRLRQLDGVVLARFEEASSAKGLLASVRRLLGNVDQSLLYGERMMFYLERTPRILAQQSDLTVDRVAERFPIATVNPDFNAWAQAAGDFGRDLPERFRDALAANEETFRQAWPEIRGTIQSAERIAASVQATVTATDSLAEKIQRLPFDESEARLALDRATDSLAQLHGIVLGLNQLLAEDAAADLAGGDPSTGRGRAAGDAFTRDGGESRVAQLARLLDERADRAMDGAFRRVAQLFVLLVAGGLVLLVAARLLFPRHPPSAQRK